MNPISVAELHQRLQTGEKLTLIDVRSPGEFAVGHIPGAILIPQEQVEARLADIPGDASVVLVCQSGKRACLTAAQIAEARPHVRVLEGGTAGWQQAGYPVVQVTATRWSLERQVRLIAGLLTLTGSLLTITVHPNWVWLPLAMGAGLTFAGATNICGMANLLALLPWNRPRPTPTASVTEA